MARKTKIILVIVCILLAIAITAGVVLGGCLSGEDAPFRNAAYCKAMTGKNTTLVSIN